MTTLSLGHPVADRDAAQLRELGITYAFALDFTRPELLRDVFTEDAVWRHGTDDVRVGIDLIARIPERLSAAYAATSHQISSQHVSLRPGGAAVVHSLCLASHLTAQSGDTGSVYEVMLRYRDECRRTARGWRIVARDLQTLWSRDTHVETARKRRLPNVDDQIRARTKEKHI